MSRYQPVSSLKLRSVRVCNHGYDAPTSIGAVVPATTAFKCLFYFIVLFAAFNFRSVLHVS